MLIIQKSQWKSFELKYFLANFAPINAPDDFL